jgi:putative peptidoglycan lipid II flippase
VLLFVTPAAVALLVFAGPLTATMFGYGRFGSRDVEMATYALMAYSWGLLGFSLVKVLAPGYFARQDTRTPVRAGLIGLAVNMGLNIAVVIPAKHAGFPAPHVLLATSTCISAAVNTTLLWRGLRRDGVYRSGPGWSALLLRIGGASVAMSALLIWLGGSLTDWLVLPPGQRAGKLAVCVTAGAATYFAALFALGFRPGQLRSRPA